MRIYWAVVLVFGSVLFVGGALAGPPGVMDYEGVANAKCSRLVNTHVGRPVMSGNCAPRIINHGGGRDPLAAVHSYDRVPYGYLKSFAYKNTPNVNVMRVHSRAPVVGLNDVPNGFSGGCTPVLTSYCRARKPVLPPVRVKAPVITARPVPVYKMQPPRQQMPRQQMSRPQILCRRAVPKPVFRPVSRPVLRPAPVPVQVVRPIIGVPHPVPTPIAVPGPSSCGGANITSPYPARIPGHIPIMAGGRWSY